MLCYEHHWCNGVSDKCLAVSDKCLVAITKVARDQSLKTWLEEFAGRARSCLGLRWKAFSKYIERQDGLRRRFCMCGYTCRASMCIENLREN